ncbi:hypothetical protein Vretimale_12353 [Volvox reticuliferus]|uniref:Uncharacterized protein n=1 Tax=Volvox reticuliferus TaxID=1737510 RepID=A0A8J4GK30_9CHLO|nr:hypothetical protein Vretimale_12353 [Volvox reticuliferus]
MPSSPISAPLPNHPPGDQLSSMSTPTVEERATQMPKHIDGPATVSKFLEGFGVNASEFPNPTCPAIRMSVGASSASRRVSSMTSALPVRPPPTPAKPAGTSPSPGRRWTCHVSRSKKAVTSMLSGTWPTWRAATSAANVSKSSIIRAGSSPGKPGRWYWRHSHGNAVKG